jgi:transcriptional regulator with XRE-family HTH domain
VAHSEEMDSWEFGPHCASLARPDTAVGLRREELAGLAGISVDYLTRLEQGRATSRRAPPPALQRLLGRLAHTPEEQADSRLDWSPTYV